ncbi:entericidin A/B family lipoprotein [Phaeobacter sp. HF9A]|nr:entericidin A/B family lipoprotein [Phaeobacter sp. HF9A]NIZ12097.1 entericidin A/B family lipoprotein [Phaeobacter sp. HF9A]
MRIFMTLIVLTALGACETMEGVGRDVSKAGNEITQEAQEAQ